MKKGIRLSLIPGAIILLGSVSHSALAVSISFDSIGFGPIVYFPDTVQESTLTFVGCSMTFLCNNSLELTPDVPLVAVTHGVEFTVVGLNDGSLFGPDETQTIETIFQVGSESIVITQDARFKQIANDQFQLDIIPKQTQTLDLGLLGLLDITTNFFAGQLRSNASGAGGLFRSTFLLRSSPSKVVEPTSALGFLIFGILGVGSALKRRQNKQK